MKKQLELETRIKRRYKLRIERSGEDNPLIIADNKIGSIVIINGLSKWDLDRSELILLTTSFIIYADKLYEAASYLECGHGCEFFVGIVKDIFAFCEEKELRLSKIGLDKDFFEFDGIKKEKEQEE